MGKRTTHRRARSVTAKNGLFGPFEMTPGAAPDRTCPAGEGRAVGRGFLGSAGWGEAPAIGGGPHAGATHSGYGHRWRVGIRRASGARSPVGVARLGRSAAQCRCHTVDAGWAALMSLGATRCGGSGRPATVGGPVQREERPASRPEGQRRGDGRRVAVARISALSLRGHSARSTMRAWPCYSRCTRR